MPFLSQALFHSPTWGKKPPYRLCALIATVKLEDRDRISTELPLLGTDKPSPFSPQLSTDSRESSDAGRAPRDIYLCT